MVEEQALCGCCLLRIAGCKPVSCLLYCFFFVQFDRGGVTRDKLNQFDVQSTLRDARC
jgi:hypothetical protein